nr:GGDEF domain-containing protein [Geodermatophilus sabuli]
MRARDPRAAARSAALILVVCAAVLVALPLLQESEGGTAAAVVHWSGILALLAAAAVCVRVDPRVLDRLGACAALAMGGIVLTATLNLLTADTSAAAQAFFAFPVLWVASHLRWAAVTLVTGAALAADGLTLFRYLPAAAALTDLLFFGAVLVVMAVMLVRANRVQEQLVVALQEQASRDALTGLVNRRVFDEALADTLGDRAAGGTALVLIDVDAFKAINDSHGHPVGDDVLVHLAGVLRDQIRAEDAVLSRLGGDELAVLLRGCSTEVAARRAAQLLDAVRATPLPLADGSLLALSISLGVAHQAHAGASLRALYSAADAALYEAKRAGRGRVAVAAA